MFPIAIVGAVIGMAVSGLCLFAVPWTSAYSSWSLLRALLGVAGACSLIPLETCVNRDLPAAQRTQRGGTALLDDPDVQLRFVAPEPLDQRRRQARDGRLEPGDGQLAAEGQLCRIQRDQSIRSLFVADRQRIAGDR